MKDIRVPSPYERVASTWKRTGNAFNTTGVSIRKAITNISRTEAFNETIYSGETKTLVTSDWNLSVEELKKPYFKRWG